LRGALGNRGGEVGGALEDKRAGALGPEAGYPVDHIGGYVGGQQSSCEDGGIDVVKASFNVHEEGGDLPSRSLEGFYLLCEGEAGVGGAESWQGATLVRVDMTPRSGKVDSVTVISLFRIFEMVLRRTMMRKEAGES